MYDRVTKLSLAKGQLTPYTTATDCLLPDPLIPSFPSFFLSAKCNECLFCPRRRVPIVLEADAAHT